MNQTTVDWALRGGSIVVALGAVALLAWALLADRSRGRKRCPKCWYAMDGVTSGAGLRCPECGHVAASEKRLRRTRRRWRWAGAAMALGAAAYGLGMTPRVMKEGWRSAIPSTLLVTIWPVAVEDWVSLHLDGSVVSDATIAALDSRIDNGEMAWWQYSLWQGRVEAHLRRKGRLGIAGEAPVLEKMASARITRRIATERFERVLDIYEEEMGVPIVADWEAMEPEQITKDLLVTVPLLSSSGVDAMDRLLRAAGVGMLSPVWWRVESGKIVVSVWDPDETALPICAYDLARAVTREDDIWIRYTQQVMGAPAESEMSMDDRLREVRGILTWHVAPEDWFENGGDRNMFHQVGTSALIRAPARVHVRIAALLDALDRAWAGREATAAPEAEWERVIDVRSKLRGSSLELAEGRMSVDSLINAVSLVSGVPIEVDWHGLDGVRVRPELELEVAAEKISAEEILDRYIATLVADPLPGVAWTIHTGAVRIGPEGRVDAELVTRVYNMMDLAPKLVEADETGVDGELARIEACVSKTRETLVRAIDPDGWTDAGGDRAWMRELGPLLVITACARRHLQIVELLEKMRAGEATIEDQ